jgi:hypothetical protein
MSDSTLHLHHPELVPTDDDLAAARERLVPAYIDYTTHVSPENMAMSIDACAYILFAAEQVKPTSAADFGSGFTSYVLRLVCDDVWSVDDSPEWLEWTRRFLDRHGVDTGHLSAWSEYQHTAHHHDLVVYDFSSGLIRDTHFEFAVGQIAPGGIGIADDMNHTGHQLSFHNACRKHKYDVFGLQDWTRDVHRRFCALVVAP